VFALVRRLIRAVVLLARDGRIPRPLRWLAAFAVLPIPGPVDEAVLLAVGLLLLGFYRDLLREAWQRAALNAEDPPPPQSAEPE
jgi:hypothetical protein